MKKKLLMAFAAAISSFLYANELNFILNKDINVQDTNMDSTYSFKEDEVFEINRQGYGIGVTTDEPLLIGICVYNRNANKNFIISAEDLVLKDNQNKVEKSIQDYYWIPDYYYEQLKDKSRTSIVLQNEPCWKTFKNSTMDQSLKWIDFFKVQRFYFGDYYLVNFGPDSSYDETGFLCVLEESSAAKLVYNVQGMYSNWDDYKDRYSHPRSEYLPLFEKPSPYRLIFTVDGDYMKMYVDEVSEKNLFMTLVRTTPEACRQIESWIKGKSSNLSKVVMPKKANEKLSAAGTNVAVNKTMIAAENLKLRAGEATSSQVLTVMSAGTKVKILELGKAETIDGINSNWVKVEVQKDAKDRDGKAIRAGTVGWCYGGYLK